MPPRRIIPPLLLAALCLVPLRAGEITPSAPKLPKDFLPAPLTAQATSYSCGAASLLSVLWYWRAYDGSESGLYAALETTPKDGTEPPKIAEVARKYGLESELKEDMTLADLRAALKRGDTVILDIQAWRDRKSTTTWAEDWEDGHYVVLVGMDDSRVYLMDPAAFGGAYAWLPAAELPERWHDYEDRHGTVRRYNRSGIVIRGKKSLKSAPAGLIRVE